MVDGTSRRGLLKAMASVPLAMTLSMTVSPLVRFLKPTLGPMNLFGPPDQPRPMTEVSFDDSDFPTAWTCKEFTFNQEYVEYYAERLSYRRIPGYAVKLPDGKVVAYSRICPHLGCVFNFVKDPDEVAKHYNYRPSGPVFACPCHFSVYDIAQDGKVVSGPAPRPPYRFELKQSEGKIAIAGLEPGNIG